MITVARRGLIAALALGLAASALSAQLPVRPLSSSIVTSRPAAAVATPVRPAANVRQDSGGADTGMYSALLGCILFLSFQARRRSAQPVVFW